MSPAISRVLEWNLDLVHSTVTTLHKASIAMDSLAVDVRADSERTFDGMSGNTIDSAHESTEKSVRRTFTLSDNLSMAAAALSNFAANAVVQQDRLRIEVDLVSEAGGQVSEDGTVTAPAGSDYSTRSALAERELAIKSALRSIGELDARSASALSDLHGSIADYGNNADPRTSIASGVINSQTDTLAALLRKSDDGLRSTTAVARGLGPFGNLLGFVSGVYGAPEDEPMSETLAAEGGGLAAGVLGGAAGAALTGAAVGSAFPGFGTVAGALGGAVIGGFASYHMSRNIRESFDNQRLGE